MRTGFGGGWYKKKNIIRNPQKPIPIMKAPVLLTQPLPEDCCCTSFVSLAKLGLHGLFTFPRLHGTILITTLVISTIIMALIIITIIIAIIILVIM